RTVLSSSLPRSLRLFVFRLVSNELQDGHLRGIAAAETELDDARVPARPLVEARAERVEQLRDQRVVGDDATRLPAVVHAVVLAQRHQALDLRPQLLRFRERGDAGLLIDERGELI